MQRTKLTVFLLFLALIAFCFVAFPVISDDTDAHPWNSDDDDTFDNNVVPEQVEPQEEKDTISVNYGDVNPPPTDDPESDLINNALGHIGFFFMGLNYGYQPEILIVYSN